MGTLKVGLKLYNDKKILTIRDLTEFITGNFGWNNGSGDNWTIPAFFYTDDVEYLTKEISLKVEVITPDKTYSKVFTRDDFYDLLTPAASPIITTQENIYFNIGIDADTDELVYVPRIGADLSAYKSFNDGIYNITYQLDLNTGTPEFDHYVYSNYVLTEYAEEILMRKTDELYDKMFSCPNFDIQEAMDYLVYRTLYASLTTSRIVSNIDAMLNIIDHINNESYEFYPD